MINNTSILYILPTVVLFQNQNGLQHIIVKLLYIY